MDRIDTMLEIVWEVSQSIYLLIQWIDWVGVGIGLSAMGSIFVLGTGLDFVREIFKKHHPECKNMDNIQFQLTFHEITRDSPYFNQIKYFVDNMMSEEHESFGSQHVIWNDDGFIKSIPTEDLPLEGFPNHSKKEVKVDILKKLNEDDIYIDDINGKLEYAFDRGFTQIYKIDSSKELGGPYVEVFYVPELPEEYSGSVDDLPIVRKEIYSRDTLTSEVENYTDTIILRTGGLILTVGFILQLAARYLT